MARRPGPSRSKKPAARRGGASGSRYGYSGKSAAKADKRSDAPPRPAAGKANARPTAKSRAQSGAKRMPKPRQGIIEVRPNDRAQDPFERAGEANAGESRIGEARLGEARLGDIIEDAPAGWSVEDDAARDDAAQFDAAEDHADLADDADETDEIDDAEAHQRVRLQRVLADAGVAARRHAEGLIEQGRVTVNGEVVRELPCFVDPHFDRIHVDGRPIPKPARHVYVMFHKPERVLVTDADEPGMDRRTLRDFVQHPAAARLFAIGRLDFQTTGVVLMTNDGELANRVSHPRANLAKTYHVFVKGAPTPQNMKVFTRAAAQGDREKAKADPRAAMKMRSRPRTPLEVRVITSDSAKSLLEVTTRDERNLDIRGACLAAGLPVKKVTRVSYGPIRLTALPLGNWRELTRPEINALKKAARLAKEGRASPPPSNPGVDFSNIPPEKLGEPDTDQSIAIAKVPGAKVPAVKPAKNAPSTSKAGARKPAPRPGPAPRAASGPVSRPAPRDATPPTKFRPRVIS